jgi:hypothetical protein
MRARLKATAQRWKNNALVATRYRRLIQARLRRSQKRVIRLEAENAALKAKASPLKVKGHTYPAQLIALAVFIVVHGNGSLRCAAKTVGFMAQLLDWPYGTPSHSSIRRWVLRCGFHQLQYATQRVGDYIGLLDEGIQIGREKLLLLLGFKYDPSRKRGRPLTGDDMVVLGMEVQQSWTGELVAAFLRQNLARMPKINLLYCVTDGGTNLAKALRLEGLDAVGDCTHIMMNAVKKALADDPVLSQLSTDIGQLRRKLMLTAEGFLLPPTLRDKDRFLRIFTIVHWVERIDNIWAKLPESSRNKLSFIEAARTRIKCMKQLKTLVKLTAGILKGAGLSKASKQVWEKAITGFSAKHELTEEAETFITKLRQFFVEHETLISKHQRLICCTDIIESTFGRYKNKGGTPTISADVLSIALYGVKITPQLVQKTLSSVSYQAVQDWETENVCENRYGIVRRMNRELKSDAA